MLKKYKKISEEKLVKIIGGGRALNFYRSWFSVLKKHFR